jgi:hypothetical protein
VVVEPFPCGPFELVGEVGFVVASKGQFSRFGFFSTDVLGTDDSA